MGNVVSNRGVVRIISRSAQLGSSRNVAFTVTNVYINGQRMCAVRTALSYVGIDIYFFYVYGPGQLIINVNSAANVTRHGNLYIITAGSSVGGINSTIVQLAGVISIPITFAK